MNIQQLLKDRFKERVFEECGGGLRIKLQPSSSYPVINDNEELEERLECCLTTNDFDDVVDDTGTRRLYHRLLQIPYLIHYPTTWYPQAAFSSRHVNYLWKRFTVFAQPDDGAISRINAMLGSTLVKIQSGYESVQLDTFSFCLMPIWNIHTTIKRRLFIAIARLLRCQNEMRNVVLENTSLRSEDGFRLLLTIALTVGPHLEHVHMVHFFRRGVLSTQLWDKEEKYLNRKTESRKLWDRLRECYHDLPTPLILYYKIFLNSLSNLVVLHVCYTTIAFGGGWVLRELACLKQGTLRQLHILSTTGELDYETSISGTVWLEVLETCPNLAVHFYIMGLSDYDLLKMLLVPGIPLYTLLLTTGSMLIDFNQILEKGNQLYIGCTLKNVIHLYAKTIRVLCLEMGRVSERLDVIICRCLTHLHYLREFYFSGSLDKLDTVREICQYLISFDTRLKIVKIRLEEDPCTPKVLQEAVAKVKEEFEALVSAKDIIFQLETFKF